MSHTPSETGSGKKHTAGAFDIRNVIAALIGIYGVILTAVGLLGDNKPAKADDVGANLWAGLAMIAVAVAFVAWARLRPTVVDEEAVEARRHEHDHDGT